MQLIQKQSFSQNRFQSRMIAQRSRRQHGSKLNLLQNKDYFSISFISYIKLPLGSKKSGEMSETPWFCQESIYCDTCLSESLVRHHTLPAFLNLNGTFTAKPFNINYIFNVLLISFLKNSFFDTFYARRLGPSNFRSVFNFNEDGFGGAGTRVT